MFGNGLDKNISLANIYRPPQRNNCNASIEDFLHEFKPVLEIFDKGNSSKIIAGDFNINLLELNDRQKFQEYFDTFVTKGFYPKLTLQHDLAKSVALSLTKFSANLAMPIKRHVQEFTLVIFLIISHISLL